LTLDDAIEVLGGARKVASGRAIDVKLEHRKSEILLDVDHRLEEIEEIEVRASSVPLSKMDREVNTQIRQLRSTQTQVSEKEEEESNTNSVQVEDATMFFESSEGKSYVNLSNDAERKALELLSLY
jgi:glycyl-tRNA synthetase (class II)